MTVHKEMRVVRHAPADLYKLVSDVGKYPEFLPWCLAARVKDASEEKLVAELIIGFNVFRERFTSYVSLDPEELKITVNHAEGPFKHLTNRWKFIEHPNGCTIDFYVDFEFNSRLLQSVIEALFTEAVKRMVKGFEKRADDLYYTKKNKEL